MYVSSSMRESLAPLPPLTGVRVPVCSVKSRRCLAFRSSAWVSCKKKAWSPPIAQTQQRERLPTIMHSEEACVFRLTKSMRVERRILGSLKPVCSDIGAPLCRATGHGTQNEICWNDQCQRTLTWKTCWQVSLDVQWKISYLEESVLPAMAALPTSLWHSLWGGWTGMTIRGWRSLFGRAASLEVMTSRRDLQRRRAVQPAGRISATKQTQSYWTIKHNLGLTLQQTP